jgi:hypothetical protein
MVYSPKTVFICTHKKRDKRCGIAGPLLLTEFNTQIAAQNLGDKVSVHGVSHIGGHKFAGNVIIYNEVEATRVADWYGRMKTCHVEAIVRETVGKGLVFRELWRGRMDHTKLDAKSDVW